MAESNREYQVVPASQIEPRPRRSPMSVIRDYAGGDYWIYAEVAAHLGVSVETIRRVTKKVNDDGTKAVRAPSSAVRSGSVVIFLFDIDDVIELEDYFEERGYVFSTKVDPKKTLKEQTP